MDDGTELEIHVGDAFEIPPGHDAWVVGDEVFDTVEFTSAAVFGLTPDENESTLATVLFTDIVDSTAMLSQVGDAAWRRLLLQHNQLMRAELDRFRGREVGTTGDGFLALFDGAARAVRCAKAMVAAVGELEIQIRAGLHTGEVADYRRSGSGACRPCGRARGRPRGPRRSPRQLDDARPARRIRPRVRQPRRPRAEGPRRTAGDLRP